MIVYQGEKFQKYLNSRSISITDAAKILGVSRQTVYQYFNSSALSANTVNNITTKFNVSEEEIFGSQSHSNARDVGEILDDEQGNTKFVEISPGRYRMGVDLVPEYAKAGYLTGFADPEYLEELPKHYITVDKHVKGKYRAFEVSGDSMYDGSINSIPHGSIVTGRELPRHHWTSKFHTHKYDYWIIVTKEDGIVVKSIAHHDVKNGVIVLHSLNTDKDTYPDFEVHLDDVLQIYNVVKKEIY